MVRILLLTDRELRGIGMPIQVEGGDKRVVKPEWGTKRTCPQCGTRFYDLKKNPAVCPKCETAFDPSAPAKPRRARSAEPKAAKPVPAAEERKSLPGDDDVDIDEVEDIDDIDDIDDTLDDDDDDDSGVMEDASELGEDEDELAEVIDNMDDKDNKDT